MAANVGSLSVSLGLDAAQYTEGLTKADVQAQQFAQQQTRTQASIDRTVASLAKQAQQVGLTTREIKLQQLAAKGASDAQLSAADASLKAIEIGQAAAAKHAKELREAEAATEGFSLASHAAQRELVVLAHELSQGNVKKFGSSLLVLAETTGAAGLLFSGLAVAVGAAAAVVGAFGFAALKGAEESHALARAIDETGNVAGLTEGKFNDLAESQAKLTNSTIGTSRDLLQSLAASGRFSGQALTAAGAAASYFAKATGASAEDASKEFVGLADDVVGGADKMNRQYHFLDAAQLQAIKTLHEQGDEQKAFIITADALSDRLKGVSTNLGTLGSAWQSIKNAASSAWDAMLNVGRTETVEEKLAAVEKQIEQTRKSAAFYQTPSAADLPPSIYTPQPAASRPPSIYDVAPSSVAQTNSTYTSQSEDELRTRQASLQDELKLTNQISEAQARKVRQDDAEIAVMRLKESSLTKQEKLTRDLANANAIFDRAGRPQADPERQQVLADIRQKAYPSNPQKSTLDLDVARIKASAQAEEEIYKNTDQVFSSLRAAGLIDEEHYYAEKLFLLQANSAAEEKALTDEIARRKIQTFTGEGAADKTNENAKAIAEAEAKLGKVRKDAATQETVLGIESDAASRKRAAGYLVEELAAQQSLDATKRAHAEEIALVGVGGEARVQATAHSQINDRYQSEIDRLNADIAAKRAAGGGAATKDDEDAYAKRLALLQDFQAKALTEWDAYYANLKKAESSATLGFQKGLADYETSIGSMADRTAKLTGDGFKSLEDILVSFATTGKLSFASLENTIIAGIARIAIQEELLKPLAHYLGDTGASGAGADFTKLIGLFGFGSGTAGAAGAVDNGSVNLFADAAPGLATGGRALPGKLYPVTERGPEVLDVNGKQYLMTGNGRANVTPVSPGGGDGSQRPIQIVQHFPPGTSKATANQAAAGAGQAIRRALSRS